MMASAKKLNQVLTIIIFSQFCCTSLWFAGNAVIQNLISDFNLGDDALANLTSSVQFGFIAGTLVFAFLAISDRFSPSRVFFVSAILGSLFNALIILDSNAYTSLFIFRFFVGFFLAGIYPVGMKIAADYFDKNLGKSLGLLVGALVLGTAFPHFLNAFTGSIPWRTLIIAISALALLGGLLVLILVPDGPYRKLGQKFNPKTLFTLFDSAKFRRAAVGYFGHMWELYAFWAFVPFLLQFYASEQKTEFNIPLLAFIIIGSGALACTIAGIISLRFGTRKIARTSLMLSGVCCLISPLMIQIQSEILFVAYLIFWGMVVIADSPLFSTLVANNAPSSKKGTALTLVNCIGFAVTILSIQLLNFLSTEINPVFLFTILAIGPLIGLTGLFSKTDQTERS